MRNAKRAGAIRRAVLSAAVITCLAQRGDAQPTAPQILTEMHWSQNDQSRVLNGEFVMQDVSAITPRDLSVRMAFLVKLPPDELFRRVLAGDFIVDPQVVSSAELVGAGSLFDLAELGLSDDAARALTGARPGPSLNLSSSKHGRDAVHPRVRMAARPDEHVGPLECHDVDDDCEERFAGPVAQRSPHVNMPLEILRRR